MITAPLKLKRSLTAFLLLVSGALSTTADAAVLFAGGEDTSFIINGTVTGVAGVSGTTYRTGFARANITVQNSTSTTDPPANRATTPTFTAATTLWIHGQIWTPSANTTTSAVQTLIIRSPDGVSRLGLRQTGTAGQLKAFKRDATPTITDLGTFTSNLAVNTLVQLDIQVIYGCTSGDVFNVWYNSVQVLNVTGSSLCTNAATTLNQVDFASANNGSSAGACAFASTNTCWSEIIVADEDTRGMVLHTACAPAAAGNTQSWTPNTLANIAKTIINDTTLISTTTQPTLSQWTCTTSAPSGSWEVKGVALNARLEVGVTGPQTGTWSFRINGSDYTSGTITPTNTFGSFSSLFTTSPATSSAWDLTGEIYKSGFNIGVKSQP